MARPAMSSASLVSGSDEQLPNPRPSRWLGRWWPLAALLAAAAAAWAITRPAPSPAHRPPPAAHARTHAACLGIPHCVERTSVPPVIARLARTYLPPHVRLRVHTVLASDSVLRPSHVVERDIDAHVDSVTVLIRVQRGGPATRAIAADPPGVGSLLLHDVNAGFVVRLQYLAPETVPPMLSRLHALLRDPRLTSA
jgi:hypothetical protein